MNTISLNLIVRGAAHVVSMRSRAGLRDSISPVARFQPGLGVTSAVCDITALHGAFRALQQPLKHLANQMQKGSKTPFFSLAQTTPSSCAVTSGGAVIISGPFQTSCWPRLSPITTAASIFLS